MRAIEFAVVFLVGICAIFILGLIILYFNVEESRPYIVIGVIIFAFLVGWIGGSTFAKSTLMDGAELGAIRAGIDGEAIKHVSNLGGQMLKHNDNVHKHYAGQQPIQNPQTENSYFALPGNFTVEE